MPSNANATNLGYCSAKQVVPSITSFAPWLASNPSAACVPARAACIKINNWIKASVSVNRQWYLSERCSPSVPVWHTSVGSRKEPLPPPARASSGSASSQHERTARRSLVAPRLQTRTQSRLVFFFFLVKRWSLHTEWSVSKKRPNR